MSNKTSIHFALPVLLAALAVYFSIPVTKKVKSGEPIDLGDAGPVLVGWVLVLASWVAGRKLSSAPQETSDEQ